MKSFTILFALVATGAAWIAPVPDGGSRSHLKTRANEQQLTNPDNEDPYTDTATGANVEKSRVLSGVGPPEADERYFDWDESCTDENHRQKIITAFNAVQELAKAASERLGDLKSKLPNTNHANKIDQENRQFISETDFAYTQMFKGWDWKIDDVKNAFDLVTKKMKDFKNRADPDKAALRSICNPKNEVKDGNGSPFCGEGSEESQALTLVPQSPQGTSIEKRYSFTKSSSITFCPAFFKHKQFPNLEDIIGFERTQDLTLDQVDCAERILLHEYMHLPWILNLRPFSDYIGYKKVAENAKAQRNSVEGIFTQPESYAWYAIYSYFNNANGGCRDAWPPGEEKVN